MKKGEFQDFNNAKYKKKKKKSILKSLASAIITRPEAVACTRVYMKYKTKTGIHGRSTYFTLNGIEEELGL